MGAGRRYQLSFRPAVRHAVARVRNVPFRALGALVGMSKDTAHRAVVELVPLLAEVGITASDGGRSRRWVTWSASSPGGAPAAERSR